jgi:hypothetical protein
MKTYKLITNAIKWRIADEKDTDDTHQQITSPSKGNKVNYDCLKDKSLMLLKNMAEAIDVSKRYYEQLKQKTDDQKQDENKVNIGCASLVQYMKNELKADAQLGWKAMLEWISDQAKLETFECNKDDNDEANKEKITTSFWENNSDEENEWNEQGSTDGDINRDDKTQDESEQNYASDNVEQEDDSE